MISTIVQITTFLVLNYLTKPFQDGIHFGSLFQILILFYIGMKVGRNEVVPKSWQNFDMKKWSGEIEILEKEN